MVDYKLIGSRIKKQREQNKLTQEQVAEMLGISRQAISKWESGQAVPELEKIVALSTVFNVTTDYRKRLTTPRL